MKYRFSKDQSVVADNRRSLILHRLHDQGYWETALMKRTLTLNEDPTGIEYPFTKTHYEHILGSWVHETPECI